LAPATFHLEFKEQKTTGEANNDGSRGRGDDNGVLLLLVVRRRLWGVRVLLWWVLLRWVLLRRILLLLREHLRLSVLLGWILLGRILLLLAVHVAAQNEALSDQTMGEDGVIMTQVGRKGAADG
jgi:hypothetical protein